MSKPDQQLPVLPTLPPSYNAVEVDRGGTEPEWMITVHGDYIVDPDVGGDDYFDETSAYATYEKAVEAAWKHFGVYGDHEWREFIAAYRGAV